MRPKRRDPVGAIFLLLFAACGASAIGYWLVRGEMYMGSRGSRTTIRLAENPSEFWSGVGFFSLVFIVVPLLFAVYLWSRRRDPWA